MSGQTMHLSVTELDESDLTAVAALERQVFPDAWSLESLKQTFELQTSLALGAWREVSLQDGMETEPELIGYLFFTQVPPEGEILRIAVTESDRRMGIGSKLLDALYEICVPAGIHKIMLEVRSGNAPAVRFYENAGFSQDGVREGYYQDPKDNALLMSRQV